MAGSLFTEHSRKTRASKATRIRTNNVFCFSRCTLVYSVSRGPDADARRHGNAVDSDKRRGKIYNKWSEIGGPGIMGGIIQRII